ncbi:MAG: prephenate dehydratase [Phormidium sp.]
MSLSIAHLGPTGTYAEAAALAYSQWLTQQTGQQSILCSYPSIAQTLEAVANGEASLGVVPIENSLEGSVTMTMDALWRFDNLQIQQALILPIAHALISCASDLALIRAIYSHPQALAQCQGWIDKFLPLAQLVPTNATTEALQHLEQDRTAGAIASQRAAQLYNLPILACPINDYPDNHTRFLVVSLNPSSGGSHTSLAFSVPANVPGALAKLLQIFASRNINLSRIESRPTKRSLGEYLFFIDIEANANDPSIQSAIAELKLHTETLKIFGSYPVLPINSKNQDGTEKDILAQETFE